MSVEFTEEEIAELEASMHESLTQLDRSGEFIEGSRPAHLATDPLWTSLQMAFPAGQPRTPPSPLSKDIFFEDELYAYDYFMPQYSTSPHREQYAGLDHDKPLDEHTADPHLENGFYFYYDGPQEDPYATDSTAPPVASPWVPSHQNNYYADRMACHDHMDPLGSRQPPENLSSAPFLRSPSNVGYWDREAYYYDLQGNLVYKPREQPDLLEELTQLNISLEKPNEGHADAASAHRPSRPGLWEPLHPKEPCRRPAEPVKTPPSYYGFATHVNGLSRDKSTQPSPRRERCRYYPYCHAGVNCPFEHTPL